MTTTLVGFAGSPADVREYAHQVTMEVLKSDVYVDKPTISMIDWQEQQKRSDEFDAIQSLKKIQFDTFWEFVIHNGDGLLNRAELLEIWNEWVDEHEKSSEIRFQDEMDYHNAVL